MPVIPVRIPQLGEGLQEALLVEFLKKPGDKITRDEPIYVMETDKATTDVESPYDGKLVKWMVEPGTVLKIGAEIGQIEVAQGVEEIKAFHSPAEIAAAPVAGSKSSEKPVRSTRALIPPKTRSYLKELNLLERVDEIPCSGRKLMPADVDAFLAAINTSVSAEQFKIEPLPKSQIVLNYRMGRGAQACIPVTVFNDIDWTNIRQTRERVRKSGGPTGFAMACWAVVDSLTRHPKFRSAISVDGNSLKVFHRVNLGVAVALAGDEMVTAVIHDADQMTADEFFAAYVKQIKLARNGKDQADESTTVTCSNIGKAGMRAGIPAIVAPAVATIALGEVFSYPVPDGDSFKFRSTVTATMSFDHRIANGIGAANFMNDVQEQIESFQL